MKNNFLFELGCEELPSASVSALALELVKHMALLLDKSALAYKSIRPFATPRRLAFIIEELQSEQQSQKITRKGPALVAAYDKAGKPSSALIGFAKSCGVELDQLSTSASEKGDWIIFESHSSSRKSIELVPELIQQALARLNISKPMRWGSTDYEFARPVHWIVMLCDNDPLPGSFYGIQTNRISHGHRFHTNKELVIKSVDSYESQLREAFVIADFDQRKQLIKEQIERIALSLQATAIIPAALLDEVCSIVEWPEALLAHFNPDFLEVPPEALIASMQSHQKCFALKDNQGALLPSFIAVANIQSTCSKQVISGNEKVMHARLSDAAFFYRQDKKQLLSSHIPATANIVFQAQLGSLYDKVTRIKYILNYLAPQMELCLEQAQRAAELSKCDLLSGMVSEFPDLQGLMGYYYALHDKEAVEVARALNEQYMPRFAIDDLPQYNLGSALSLADRIDTLVGIFAIGQKPSGDKDPFKLRRHALAVARLIMSSPYTLSLKQLISTSVESFKNVVSFDANKLKNELHDFIFERVNSYFQGLGFTGDLVQAVRARQEDNLFDFDRRIYALKDFSESAEAASLSAACKRVGNILSQSSTQTAISTINIDLLEEGAEQLLNYQLNKVSALTDSLYQLGDYVSLLQQLSSLKEPIDAFFDQVMVLVQDEKIKKNRLSLLFQLQKILQGVADISLLQTK